MPSFCPGGRKSRRGLGHGSTSGRPSTRRVTRRSLRSGRTRRSCPGISTLAKEYPEVRGHVFFAAKEVKADRIGAMARVVADHYQGSAQDVPGDRGAGRLQGGHGGLESAS